MHFADRQPPYAPEAELSVLGAILLDPGFAMPRVADVLDANAFYREAHRRMFRVMQRLFDRGITIDVVYLREELQKTDELDVVGGMPFLSDLLDSVPTAANVEYHARIVKERAQLRRLIEAGSQIIQLGYEPSERPIAQILDEAGQRMFEALSANDTSGPVLIRKDMTAAFAKIEELQNATGGITGLSTGLVDFDEMTGGLQNGDFVVFAARPSMGKTGLATTIALNAAITLQKPVLFFSLEMSRQALLFRMLCHEAHVDLSKLLKGRLHDDDYVRLAQAAGHVNSAPIYIDNSPGISVTQMRARARRLKAEVPELALIVVDYVQLMEADGENRTQQVSIISRGLKGLAVELDVPLLGLSQLSRAVEQRTDKKPQLSDLRESGALEQDADLVGLLFRPEYYHGAEMTVGRGKNQRTIDVRGKAELNIAKQRNGATGTVDLYYRKETVRFENWSDA